MDEMNKKEEFMDNLKNYEKPVEENKKPDTSKIAVDKNLIYDVKNRMQFDLRTMKQLVSELLEGKEEDRIPIAELLMRKIQEMEETYSKIEKVEHEARADDAKSNNLKRSELEEVFK